MFWFGLFLALVSGLISLNSIRTTIQRNATWLVDWQFDILKAILLLTGLSISVIKYVDDGNKKDELSGEVSDIRTKRDNLAAEVSVIKEYSEMARYDLVGSMGLAGVGLIDRNPIAQALSGAFVVSNGRVYPKCDSVSRTKFSNVSESFPRFPFAEYALATCLRNNRDESWRIHARRAYDILSKTTTIAGHNANHDEAYKHLKEILGPDST